MLLTDEMVWRFWLAISRKGVSPTCEIVLELSRPHCPDESLLLDRKKDTVKDLSN